MRTSATLLPSFIHRCVIVLPSRPETSVKKNTFPIVGGTVLSESVGSWLLTPEQITARFTALLDSSSGGAVMESGYAGRGVFVVSVWDSAADPTATRSIPTNRYFIRHLLPKTLVSTPDFINRILRGVTL